jgi:gentisate 1,2-dioxygenase
MTTEKLKPVEADENPELYDKLAQRELMPLWKLASRLNTPSPRPKAVPFRWRWADLEPLAAQAGVEVPITRGGDRRVLVLANPGLDGKPFATPTLWGGIQYLGGHETAPAHRHSASAIRFVMAGSGVFTAVNGEKLEMSVGDLIVTPNWFWHEHTNPTETPMAWFDGLDLPAVVDLDAVFFELPGEEPTPERGPYEHPDTSMFTTRMRIPWAEMEPKLEQALEGGNSWATVPYTDEETGKPVMPTLGCEAHRIRPGGRSEVRRKVGSSVYVVFRGSGAVTVAGEEFSLAPGDCFVTPSWSQVSFEAGEPLDLFAITDRPLLEALTLFREETVAP